MSELIQRNFSGGEIAPVIYARVDTLKYQTGLRTMRNMFTMRHGGATNRPGTQFVGEVYNSQNPVRLIRFVFSRSQSYVLEFGNETIRFIQNGQYLISDIGPTITGITTATQAVVTSAGHGFNNGDEIQIDDVVGMVELNGRTFTVSDKTTNTFKLKYNDGTYVDSTGFGAYSSGGGAFPYLAVASPYQTADLAAIHYTQSADVLTLVHPSYTPHELKRLNQFSWTLTSVAGDLPSIDPPSATGANPFPAAPADPTDAVFWIITSVKEVTLEESLPTDPGSSPSDGGPGAGAEILIWDNVTGAVKYNIYKAYTLGGPYGYVGTVNQGPVTTSSFADVGQIPDFSKLPPVHLDLFNATDDYPSTVSYAQQRLVFGSTNNDPEKGWASRTGYFKNFTVSYPSQADDSLSWTMAGQQVNRIKHFVDLNGLICFTDSGEWVLEGDNQGVLTPSSINPRQHTYNGTGDLQPIVIDETALYVQDLGNVVRDFGFDWQIDGYHGNDLTLFATHLFEGFSITDWDYQKIPNSIVWAARSDGELIALTYVKDQQILAWHHHDIGGDGFVENVCCVPEGNETAVYFTVKRTINGIICRYIERLSSRFVTDIKDANFLDAQLEYDGRNIGATTMTLSGGTSWTHAETLTLTASAAAFDSSDPSRGNQIQMTLVDGSEVRLTITAYTSTTVVSVKASKTIPAADRGTAHLVWAKAVTWITGLWHLEGKNVAVVGDGFVVSNPNNPEISFVASVFGGLCILNKPYAVVQVGLPYVSDFETLDIDTANGETMIDKKKRIGKIHAHIDQARGLWFGGSNPDDDKDSENLVDGLNELKVREYEDYDDTVAIKSGVADIVIQPQWNSNGRIFIRQIDPFPFSVLSVAVDGNIPFRQLGAP